MLGQPNIIFVEIIVFMISLTESANFVTSKLHYANISCELHFGFFSNVESQHINTSLDISKRVGYNFCSIMNSALISFDKKMKY